MKKPFKILAFVIAFIVTIFIGLSIFIGTLDADKYRPQLVNAIEKQTGRAVRLNGPISFSLGLGGAHVLVQDASIANPAWASRPTMAGMGRFELGVGLLPLLAHRLSVNELTIENADILLETGAAGQHNWDFAPPAAAPSAKSAASSSSVPGGSLSIGSLTVTNSQLALRGADGKTSSFNVAALHLGMNGAGAELTLKADINGAPVTLDVKTGLTDLLSRAPFSFDADATYNGIRLTAKGKADLGNGRAEIASYELSAGKSKIAGNLAAAWNGARPSLRGALNSDHLDMGDFRTAMTGDAGEEQPAAAKTESKPGPKHMFSDAPLPLNGLKSVDADFDVAVGEFPLGKDALKKITAKLALSGGNLTLAPVKASVGSSPVDVQLKLDAARAPAHLSVGVIANGVDLGDLQKLGDMSPFMTGKAGADIQLTGEGDSAHDIAASLGGVVNVTAEKGEILTGAAAGISSSLAALFNPQGGGDALNCLAARFIAKNGVLTDNGILIDSATSTVAGKGNVNLGSETVDLALNAKTKLVDIGGLVPALKIGGGLSDPHYSVDAAGVVKNAIGSLVNGNVDIISSNVPDIQAPPAGQNACVYTLDHPKAASSSGVLPSNAVGKASQKINSLIKGLFGQ